MAIRPRLTDRHELRTLQNVGPATLGDLLKLGITSIAQLATQDADHLFNELERITGSRQNSCMRALFAAIIHEAKTGEKTPWRQWTTKCKKVKS